MTYINIYDMDNNALSHHNNQLANKLIIDTSSNLSNYDVSLPTWTNVSQAS